MSNDNTDSQILQALERLGAQFPWDTTAVWTERHPNGDIEFTAYIPSDYDRGTESVFGRGETLAECCRDLVKKAGDRTPEATRDAAIRDLEDRLAKLKAAIFGHPPYRPGTRLTAGALNAEIEV